MADIRAGRIHDIVPSKFGCKIRAGLVLSIVPEVTFYSRYFPSQILDSENLRPLVAIDIGGEQLLRFLQNIFSDGNIFKFAFVHI